MPDYLFEIRVTADINLLPRGTDGALLGQANSNIGGFGPNDIAAASGAAQTLRKSTRVVVPNNPNTPPTAANIAAAITTAGANIQANLPPSVMAMISNWALGQE